MAQGARLEALLREDALTGLSNRRAILTQLAGMVSGARRHGHPLSIAVLRHRSLQARSTTPRPQGRRRGARRRRARDGHPSACRRTSWAGSAARSSSSCCPTRTRTPPGTWPSACARRWRARASRCPITVSIGIATWDGETPEEFLARADEALYAAKDAGRDRVLAATLHDRT